MQHELRTPISLIGPRRIGAAPSRGRGEYARNADISACVPRRDDDVDRGVLSGRGRTRADGLNLQPIDLRGTMQDVATAVRDGGGASGLQFSERILEASLRVLGDEAALRTRVNVAAPTTPCKYTESPGAR